MPHLWNSDNIVIPRLLPGHVIALDEKSGCIVLIEGPGRSLYWFDRDDKKLVSFIKNQLDLKILAEIIAETHGYCVQAVNIYPAYSVAYMFKR